MELLSNTKKDISKSQREMVNNSFISQISRNQHNYLTGEANASAEYIWPNQQSDADHIVKTFYENLECRVQSVQKPTKIGANGFMLATVRGMTTHHNDSFMTKINKTFIITGMSNLSWQSDFIKESPDCLKDNIYHHGQLNKLDLNNMIDSLIIIDEIDTGDKEGQILHMKLKQSGILDIEHMNTHNNRIIVISATMIKELYELYNWGPDIHKSFQMTIPRGYIGVSDFLSKNIIQEFYSLTNADSADKWVKEDIVDNYGNDYRVHLCRATSKTLPYIEGACSKYGVLCMNHTSVDRISSEELEYIFTHNYETHIVLCVKGFYRRANLIPNRWKLRIGCTHERHTKIVDNNVQIQGFPGRLTGYWRENIENGHKTGPFRTSIKAVEQYKASILDPFSATCSYQTSGFNKKRNKVSTKKRTLLHTNNVENLDTNEVVVEDNNEDFERGYEIFNTQLENDTYAKQHGAKNKSREYKEINGFKICSTSVKCVHSLDDIEKIAKSSNLGSNLDRPISSLEIGEYAHRRYVCYRDLSNKESECYVTIWTKRIK
jgi:hypothetical protein